MICETFSDDRPMTAALFYDYLKWRYADLRLYFNRDPIVIQLNGDMEDADINNLYCTYVCAAWPEYIDEHIIATDKWDMFLVVYDVTGKYIR